MVHAAPRFTVPFSEIALEMLPEVGGKNASLGEMIRALAGAGVRVPPGFAITVEAYRRHLERAAIGEEIYEALDRLDLRDVEKLAATARGIRERIASAHLPEEVSRAIEQAYAELSRACQSAWADVAVRSSATAEDLPGASFAGQQETWLNVRGAEDLDRAVRGCMASLFTDRAIVYRVDHGIPHRRVAISVGVQQMVRSDLASAGVIFTLDPESGFREVVLVTGSWGLGESVVQGRVNPDEFWVHKPTLRRGFRPIVRRELGTKAVKLVYGERCLHGVEERRVSLDERARFVLADDEVLELARASLAIEEHYSRKHGRPTPMDIEWAKDGSTGELFVVQARPETVHAQRAKPSFELFKLKGKGRVLARGKSVGAKVATGPVRVVRSPAELGAFRDGEVLVAEMTDPDWEPVLRRAVAVVTDAGGRTCHAAIVSRELGIPCVVGTGNASRVLRDGDVVTISCAEGEEGRVYAGAVPFERETVDPETLPKPPVPLMLDVANPDVAFHVAQLPSAGVGLLRIEFLVTHWIGVHPMALVHPERVEDPIQRAEIERRAAQHGGHERFFVDRLASGVATIAAAFHPRPVLVRFSDFKTSEYANLLGGRWFEPSEGNPMIGWRGASRYHDERYREGFALECRALRKAREEMGFENVKVMIPFCRTLEEGRRVLAELEKYGMKRGEKELEVWVMCEIPNNVILAEEFAELFDGFSIGSNDLTQLALGVDRDSQLLAHLFDERDPGVKRLLQMVVERAHARGRRVGICGQAPSDHPDFAEFLAAIGIDSISLTPDSLPKVARRLAAGRPRVQLAGVAS
jgi:pyruvate,water dikinase